MATKKSTAKKSAVKDGAKKAASTGGAKKIAAKQSSAKSSAKGSLKKATAKKSTAKKTTAKKATAKKAGGTRGKGDNYTKPELRERIKKKVLAGDKGGRPGQWSARKAQLVAHEYVAEGGGYEHERTDAQEHLKQWGDEKWHTADGKQAIQGNTTHRYLPDKAWAELTPAERKATDKKKVRGSRKGKQFVANTDKAKEARIHVEKE